MRSATNKYYRFGRGFKDEEAFINLLKNDGIFDWFLKQYEEVFSPSFCMDSREYEDVKQ